MARYDQYDEDYYDDIDLSNEPVQIQQEFLYEQIGFKGLAHDPQAREYFWDIMYNDDLSGPTRLEIYDEFVRYLWNEYGIAFADIWDWEDFRSWYETA